MGQGAGDADLQAVLPPAEENVVWQNETPAPDGRDASADDRARTVTAAGFEDQGSDVCSVAGAWEQLLEKLRGDPDPVANGGVAEALVGTKPEDGILCAQGNGESNAEAQVTSSFVKHLWVINTMDWIDVEHVLRKMLRCDSSDCFAFCTTGYAFFRSCATMHVTHPSDFLRGGETYRFPATDVTVEILRAHPEGILEVACYFEYVPV